MKRILMSLMIIGLVGGLMGSALADFSDIETSHGNYFESGSLDLKVSDADGNLYEDPTVPAFFQIEDAWPCCYKDVVFDLTNDGQGSQKKPWAYLHITNLDCYGIIKTEPENAAELALTPVGIDEDGNDVYATDDGSATGTPLIGGDYGENCELSKHVDIEIEVTQESTDGTAGNAINWVTVDLSAYDANADGIIKMNEVKDLQLELGELANEDDVTTTTLWENRMFVQVTLHLQDVDEDDLGFHLFDETIPNEAKWDHWPTNALMKDGMSFDIVFELLQTRVPGD